MQPQRERSEVRPRAGWMVMGKRARLSALEVCNILITILSLFPVASLQCKILKCNSDFWASTSNSAREEEFCTALRAYNGCVRRTARTCRGDLAYHSAQHGIEDLMSQHNCSKEGPTAPPRAHTSAPPPPSKPPAPDSQERSDGPEVCHYERSVPRHAPQHNYTHCGFFGDPHLRTFGDEFQTCRVEGAWPLIHNKFLSVQVTNSPVVPGSLATATSKLTIIFKNFQECVDQKMYKAETDELPAAFADGSKNGGDRHGANTLRVVERVPGQHVEIQARYIGTTIVVRQVGRYLTFAVRMPEEVVHSVEEGDDQDLYLCLHGCPANQLIDFRTFRARATETQGKARVRSGTAPHGFTYQAARARCKERLPVEDVYFQSCLFDLLSSGDINFTMAAYYAFEDVKMLHSNSKRYHLFEKDPFVGNAAPAGLHWLQLVLVHCLTVYLWTECCSAQL
ncbi:repulsive guidance molecule A isoform X1 [Gadus morhua]|uniref:Repulsive guidance molecule BMP co-receptor a n=2 Tax=Gadus morhua TaxID=8049 RepID=A0A8C5BZ55_GADMO|nr:repulsive guidance molecule A isoform X1 [Gadus morhua]XP_030221942.1 repulsive guidance molecule A isoform X1 [Gadus morhua]